MASSLLIPESPLTVLPSLAVQIGLNEAIFLQQVQYWISREAGFCDESGRRWIYNSVKQWREQFPFWSDSTVKRTIRSLEEQGVLLSTTIGDAFNKTKAYTIDYERIEELSQKIVHEQMRTSINSVKDRVSFPSPQSSSSHTFEMIEDDKEGQKVKTDDPLDKVKLTQREDQNEPIGEVKLTQSNRPAESPETARVFDTSSRARVTETTTTEMTQKIRETTTGDVRSLCAALGISSTSLEQFIRRYGIEKLHEKARLLEIAMQTQSIRNPTGWLHAALKDGYTFSPIRSAPQEEKAEQRPKTRPYVPPSQSSKPPQKVSTRADLQEVLNNHAEESEFAREFLRRREGRTSP